MQFHSLGEFFTMAGHGPYVWSALGITVVVVLALVISPIVKRRNILQGIRQRKQFEEQH